MSDDLQVLAQAFEECRDAFVTRGPRIAALTGEFGSAHADLGNPDIAGDDGRARGQLQDGLGKLTDALGHVGDSVCPSLVAGLTRVLEHFQEVDRRQAANPRWSG